MTGQFRDILLSVVDCGETFKCHRLCEFELAKQLRAAVLQGLESTNFDIELFAVVEIGEGSVEEFASATEHFCTECQGGAVESRPDKYPCAVARADNLTVVYNNLLEVDPSETVSVHAVEGGDSDASGLFWHEYQREPVGAAGLGFGAGEN